MTEANSITGDFVPRRATLVTGVELDGEAVLYSEQAHTVHVLNRTATLVWNCLDGDGDLNSLAEELSAAFGIDIHVLREDVLDIVRMFGRQGLIDGIEPDPAVVSAQTLAFDPDTDGTDE